MKKERNHMMNIFDILGLDEPRYLNRRIYSPASLMKNDDDDDGANRLMNFSRAAEDLVYADNRDYDLDVIWTSDAVRPAVKEYVLRVAYAPFKKSEIDVKIDENGLLVQTVGKTKTEPEEEEKKNKKQGDGAETTNENNNQNICSKLHTGISSKQFRVYLSFARLIDVTNRGTYRSNTKILTDEIKATADEGVVEIHVPIGETVVSRTVKLS